MISHYTPHRPPPQRHQRYTTPYTTVRVEPPSGPTRTNTTNNTHESAIDDHITSTASLNPMFSVVSSVPGSLPTVSFGLINPPVERSTSVMFCTPAVTPNMSLPVVEAILTGNTKPATWPDTERFVKHEPKMFTKAAPLTGNSTRAISDSGAAGFGKIKPSTPCSTFVKSKFDSGAPVLITGHSAPAEFLPVHSKKCTVIPPINVLEVIVPVDVSFAHVTVSPAARRIPVPLVPVSVVPTGPIKGAADATDDTAKPTARMATSIKLANRAIFMSCLLVGHLNRSCRRRTPPADNQPDSSAMATQFARRAYTSTTLRSRPVSDCQQCRDSRACFALPVPVSRLRQAWRYDRMAVAPKPYSFLRADVVA